MSSQNHLNELNKRLQLQTALRSMSSYVQKHLSGQLPSLTQGPEPMWSCSNITKVSVWKEDTEISEDVKAWIQEKKKLSLHSLVVSVTLVEAVQEEHLQYHLRFPHGSEISYMYLPDDSNKQIISQAPIPQNHPFVHIQSWNIYFFLF